MKIDSTIQTIDKAICRHISQLDSSGRGEVSQDILKNLRDFVEHLALKIYAQGNEINDDWKSIQDALAYIKPRSEWKTLTRFHQLLQISVSHYTPDEENSERLMLKYYTHLVKLKDLINTRFSLSILENLDKFPLNTDITLQEYYRKISEQVNTRYTQSSLHSDKFYIRKIKPFFVNGQIYYEVTFTPANDNVSKFEREIAFTKLDITDNYAVKLSFSKSNITIHGKSMPIHIIRNWEVSIRDCEFRNFTAVVRGVKEKTSLQERKELTYYLSSTGFNFVDLIEFSDADYNKIRDEIVLRAKSVVFLNDLDRCRAIIRGNRPGSNLLRYLLYHMNNKLIKAQYKQESNSKLSDLHLEYGCIPFDNMPFCRNPKDCRPRIRDLFACIPVAGREHELLARFVMKNTEINGQLFTPYDEVKKRFGDVIDTLVTTHNSALYRTHRPNSELVVENKHIYIYEYKNDVCHIINELAKLAKNGIQNYSAAVNAWLAMPNNGVDCIQKKEVLTQLFESSRVALIYGSAGTGKSTLINHIAQLFDKQKKLFLAHTNPAVENLKRRIKASECTFSTITKILHSNRVNLEYDIIVVDECSTVSNSNMRGILNRLFSDIDTDNHKMLVLVGDTYQIESIEFGNWFDLARKHVPNASVCELTTPWRSSDKNLIELWKRVRGMDGKKSDEVLELLTHQNYTKNLDETIFSESQDDEIILCLNYDGLYGINNINRFLQESNTSSAVTWGIQQYKVNDPILFNDSDRFSPAIHNNMKGRISNITILENNTDSEKIQFDIELDKVMMGMDAYGQDFELLQNATSGNSVIRFSVSKIENIDEDSPSGHSSRNHVLPFQIAYAVSIHKAQGLEYDSVKMVITDEIDELISHNIFYTAITRAKRNLKIYWSPEVEKKVLESIKPKDIGRDVSLLQKDLKVHAELAALM